MKLRILLLDEGIHHYNTKYYELNACIVSIGHVEAKSVCYEVLSIF